MTEQELNSKEQLSINDEEGPNKLGSIQVEITYKPTADSHERVATVLAYLLDDLINHELSLGLEKPVAKEYNFLTRQKATISYAGDNKQSMFVY